MSVIALAHQSSSCELSPSVCDRAKAASSEELASTFFTTFTEAFSMYHGHPMAIEAASSALRASMGTYLTCVLARRDGRTRADK